MSGHEPEGGDPACWADQFEALLFGEPDDGDEAGGDDPEDEPATR